MTISEWSPEPTSTPYQIDHDLLVRLCAIDLKQPLSEQLTPAEQSQHAPLMRQEKSSWQQASQNLSNEQIVQLIRFFTLAEMQLNGWEAGEKSPVIHLNKALRQRGDKLDKDMLRWIKANSDNRFIPNGAL